MAQQVEHVLGKDEVTGSNPVSSSILKEIPKEFGISFFSLSVALSLTIHPMQKAAHYSRSNR